MRLDESLLYYLLSVLLTAGYVISAEFGQFDNGFDTDDADKAKWIASANCVHSFDATGAPDGAVEFIIDAYENDAMFYEFESCVMVDYFDLIGGTVTKEAAACVVDRQSAVTTEAEYKHFRYSEVNPSATTSQAAGADGGSTCGGYKDGTILFLAMYCYRDDMTLKQGDAVFLAQCNADTQYAVMTVLTYGELTIGPPIMQPIVRRNELTFDVLDGLPAPDYDSDMIKTVFGFGDPVRLRICLKINSVAGDTRTEFAEGTDPMGFVVGECIATRHADHTDDAADPERVAAAGTPISTSKGCGLGAPLAQQAGTDDWFMFWAKSASDGADAYKKSPNCWYSESYEAISNLGKNIGAPSERKITLTCTIEHFCISSSDTECFGDKSGLIKADGSGYPTCPAGFTARRRRRNVFPFSDDDMPDAVNTTFTVRTSTESGAASTDQCFTKKSTFFAVVGVLVFLVLFSSAVVALLFCKVIRRGRREGSESSKTGFGKSLENGSHFSKGGLQNKGFSDDRTAYYR